LLCYTETNNLFPQQQQKASLPPHHHQQSTMTMHFRKSDIQTALEQRITSVVRMLNNGTIQKHSLIYVANLQKGIRMSFESGYDRTESRLDIWTALRNNHIKLPSDHDATDQSFSSVLNQAKVWS
jgi:glucan biosynthesis protein